MTWLRTIAAWQRVISEGDLVVAHNLVTTSPELRGIISDTFVLSHRGTAEGFEQAAKTLAPQTDVRILPPGRRLEILHVPGRQQVQS